MQNTVDRASVKHALDTVIDPELKKPITELGMVSDVKYKDDNVVEIHINLTVATCPLKNTIKDDVIKTVSKVKDVRKVTVILGVMNADQRKAMREKLAGANNAYKNNPFTKPGNTTKIYAISSGKGGVGKSSITANLAIALSQKGLKIGVMDADIYGFSIPRILGVKNEPQTVDSMIIPPVVNGIKVMSIGMFVPPSQAVIWRGPMLHRALQQFLNDVYWGDIDILLIDLPPGTGDIAISIAQLLPKSEIIVVTTPQIVAAEVSGRTGAIGHQTNQKVVGVIENMSYLIDTAGAKIELFGRGGGKYVSKQLSNILGYDVPLLAQIPIDIRLRTASDQGKPIMYVANIDPIATENNTFNNKENFAFEEKNITQHSQESIQKPKNTCDKSEKLNQNSEVILQINKIATYLSKLKRGLSHKKLSITVKDTGL